MTRRLKRGSRALESWLLRLISVRMLTTRGATRSIEMVRPSEIAGGSAVQTGCLMDPGTVEELEEKIEQSVAEVLATIRRRKLPKIPDQRTMHRMAKSAVTVLEAAIQKKE